MSGRVVASLLASLACGAGLVFAQETPPAAPPEPPAIAFAKRDVAKLTERLAAVTQAQGAATQAATAKQAELEAAKANAGDVAAAEAALKTANDQKAAADALVPPATEKLKAAETRLGTLSTVGIQPDPTAIREIAKFAHPRAPTCVRWDAHGDSLVVGAQSNVFWRWDVHAGTKTDMPGHESWVYQVGAYDDGKRLVTGAYDGKMALWDLSAGAPPKFVDAHVGHLRAVTVSADGKLIATGGNDREVKLWSAADGSPVATFPGHGSHVYSVAFDPSGAKLFSGDLMGVIKQWDVAAKAHVRDLDAGALHKYDEGFQAHAGGVRSMEVSPDGKWLLAAGVGNVTNAFAGIGDPTAIVFDLEAGAEAKKFSILEQNQGSFWGARWRPAGDFAVLCGWGKPGSLWFYRPGEDKPFHEFKLPANGYDCAFHPDGLRLAVALFDKTVVVYDLSPKAP